MLLVKDFLKRFLHRSGNAVFLATVLSRIFSFIGSWLALRLIDNKELGVILFAFSIVQFIIPLAGLGLHQSLLRYGALISNSVGKENLFNYALGKGIRASFVMIVAIVGLGYFVPFQFENTSYYLALLSVIVLPMFTLEVIKVQFRLQHKNKLFALTDFGYSLILMGLIYILSYYWQGLGYVMALLLAPTFAALIFLPKLNIRLRKSIALSIDTKQFWRYGIYGGLSNVATQLLFVIDMILIGYLMDNAEAVTNYRYVSIIPFSLLFLPRVFMNTDFVTFTEKIYDQTFIGRYTKSYLIFFALLSVAIMAVSFGLSEHILQIFGSEFVQYSLSFMVLIIGVVGIFVLRGLYGNLLSSLGKIEINYYITSIAIVLNLISNFFLIPQYGILGAALTSAALMWLTGIASWLLFVRLYKKSLKENS